MSSFLKSRRGVVTFGPRRSERLSGDAERNELDARDLERERLALIEERQQLEKERVSFEEDLKVLEEQRRFLDGLRERLRQDTAALEAERLALSKLRGVVAQRTRVEGALEDARKSREAERLRLQTEMAGMLRRHHR